MNPLFSEWYGAASVDTSDEMLRKRWAGVEKAADELGSDLNIVRLFAGRANVDTGFVAAFRKIFFDLDATFRPHGNEAEVNVLAGAVLAHIFGRSEGLSSAIAVICANCGGLAAGILVPDAIELAKQVVMKRALDFRNPNVRGGSNLDNYINSLSDLQAKVSEQAEVKTLGKVTADFMGQIVEAMREIKVVDESRKALVEEINILWWLFGEYSSKFDKPYREYSAAAASLIAGRELADLTSSQVGPASVDAILNRMLSITDRHNTEIPLKAAFEATSADQRRILVDRPGQAASIDLCPIHFALNQAQKLGDISDAIKNTGTLLNLKMEKSLRPVHWASQFYRECQFQTM